MTLAEKYDTTTKWIEPCGSCGVSVEVCNAYLEVVGPYCEGCMGFPVCSCDRPHKGRCDRKPVRQMSETRPICTGEPDGDL